MLHYERSVFVQAPVEKVFAFHERTDALELLTPPGQDIQVLRRAGGLRLGAEVELLVPLGPLRMRWLARHTAYERDRLFVDEQMSGPFAKWRHRHQFGAEGTGCRLTDSVDFALPLAPVSEWVAGWVVRSRLATLFQYRHEVTRRYCESGG
jgi:ligand-binding SRPBCC domain-containing protein